MEFVQDYTAWNPGATSHTKDCNFKVFGLVVQGEGNPRWLWTRGSGCDVCKNGKGHI